MVMNEEQGPHQLRQIADLSPGNRCLTVEVFSEGIEAARKKLASVFEDEPAQTEGQILFVVLGDNIDAAR